VKRAPTMGKLLPLVPLPLSYLSWTNDLGREVWITNA